MVVKFMSKSGNEVVMTDIKRFYEESVEKFDLSKELLELVLDDKPILLSVIYQEEEDERCE